MYIDAEFTVLYTLSTCKDVALAQVPAMVDLGSIMCHGHAELLYLGRSANDEVAYRNCDGYFGGDVPHGSSGRRCSK